MNNMKVKIDEDKQRFFAMVDGKECMLEFKQVDEDTLEYFHTFVPSELRGRGLAGQIVGHALKHAQDNGKKVVPTCSYVREYIEKHPEYESLVAE